MTPFSALVLLAGERRVSCP